MRGSSIQTRQHRLESIDFIRGIAVFGILLMNIQAFAMPSQGYFNPFAFNTVSAGAEVLRAESLFSPNGLIYVLTHVFIDQKFMAIFSMLFGISIAIASHRDAPNPTRYFCQRYFVLLIFGLIHAYLIWDGDILVSYGLCGLFVMLFRQKSTDFMLKLAVVLFIVPILLFCVIGQIESKSALEMEFQQDWVVTNAQFMSLTAGFTSSWPAQLPYRIANAFDIQVGLFVLYTFWRTSALMLIGIALYNSGLFHGKWSTKETRNIALIISILGVCFTTSGLVLNSLTGWQALWAHLYISHFNHVGSLLLGLGYMLWFLLMYKHFNTFLRHVFVTVGRLALSNYLLQSIVAGFVFYGHGLGLYASLTRAEQLMLVPAIWLLLASLSMWWSRFFIQGPFEWLMKCVQTRKFSRIYRFS